MSKKEKVRREKAAEISKLITKWNYEYYVLGQPSVTDQVYDEKFNELLSIEKDLSLKNSLTQKIGFLPQVEMASNLVKREIPMLSLESFDDIQKLESFLKRLFKKISPVDCHFDELIGEWKIDGVSISLVYQNGKLFNINTRGDGKTGEDLTKNFPVFADVPQTINHLSKIEIRGEAYMKKTIFSSLNEKLNEQKEKFLSNPRNSTAGILRNFKNQQKSIISFYAYQIIDYQNELVLTNQESALRKLLEWNFSVSPDYQIIKNWNDLQEFLFWKEKSRESLDFDVDGVVLKINSFSHQKKLSENKKFPRWAVAYKFKPFTVLSTIKEICLEVTRSGKVSYVARITPVNLHGSIIENVTLHNYNFIREKKINLEDKVLVGKAGDIIPQILQNLTIKDDNSVFWQSPTNCPSCQSVLFWNETKIFQICNNYNCQQRRVNELDFFASKQCMNIKGLSKRKIQELYKNGILNDKFDFYTLGEENKREKILEISGFNNKSLENLIQAIEKSKSNHLSRLISSFGIPNLSYQKSEKICSEIKSLREFEKEVFTNDCSIFQKHFGQKTAESVRKFFSEFRNKNLLRNFQKIFN